jgi:hypothetical protein
LWVSISFCGRRGIDARFQRRCRLAAGGSLVELLFDRFQMLPFRADLLLETLALLVGIEFLLHFVQAIQRNREFLLQFIDAGGATRIVGGRLLSKGQRQNQQGYGNEQETFPEPVGTPLQMVLGWLMHT